MDTELRTPSAGTTALKRAGAAAVVGLACYGLVTLGAALPCLASECAGQQPRAVDGLASVDARLVRLEERFSRLQEELDDAASARFETLPVRSPPSPTAADGELRDEVFGLYAEIAGIYREIEALRASASVSGVGTEAVDLAVDGSPEPERLREQENAATARHFAAMDTRLASQDVDPAWSMSAADTIERAFAGEALAGVSLHGVDCRSTLCRVDISVPGGDGAGADNLPVLLLPALGTSFNGFAMNAGHGAGEDARTVYLWNEEGGAAN